MGFGLVDLSGLEVDSPERRTQLAVGAATAGGRGGRRRCRRLVLLLSGERLEERGSSGVILRRFVSHGK